ncbi:hypothetical protein Phum_PHUM451600 [Pediculus humanus corporis]|uniref:Uncharacterized protein n=1 Tax=Pediculus humanus subsp. corporis TaxID=121224 RepID=E0VUK3_PEDHC|nr:uncharacterized protein Phum_PHUM451600 [Pediculus humanus corporis]EEB17059.1 hypothetical protein Phum_PHUM451600 [Pediculus humanus corporis]
MINESDEKTTPKEGGGGGGGDCGIKEEEQVVNDARDTSKEDKMKRDDYVKNSLILYLNKNRRFPSESLLHYKAVSTLNTWYTPVLCTPYKYLSNTMCLVFKITFKI